MSNGNRQIRCFTHDGNDYKLAAYMEDGRVQCWDLYPLDAVIGQDMPWARSSVAVGSIEIALQHAMDYLRLRAQQSHIFG